MFITVAIYFGLRTETVIKIIGESITNNLISEVKKDGYLTLEEYETYMDKMSLTATLYDIQFEHTYQVQEPEYRLRTEQEIIDAQNAAYTGTNNYVYREVTTNKPIVTDPVNDGSLNTQTNASVLAAAINTPASASHVHTAACYEGHIHTPVTANPFVIAHKHTAACTEYTSSTIIFGTCLYCGKEYNVASAYYYWDPSKDWTGSIKGVTLSGSYLMDTCPNCNRKAGTNNTRYIYSYGYSCGFNKDLNGDGYNDKTAYVNTYNYDSAYPEVVGELAYSPDDGKNIIYPSKQTYTNGCYSYHVHGKIPGTYNGWTYGLQYNSSIISRLQANGWKNYCELPTMLDIKCTDGSHTIGVSYSLSVVNGVLTCYYAGCVGMHYLSVYPTLTIDELYAKVNYQSEFFKFLKTNPLFDYDYGLSQSGSMKTSGSGQQSICSLPQNTWYLSCTKTQEGSALCSQIITSITATHPVQTVAVGDPLITTVTANFLDGSTKVVLGTTTFSTNNITKNQEVTFTYNYSINGNQYSKSCIATITVVPRSKTCSKGHTYNLSENGADPGCPYCKAWVEKLKVISPETASMTIAIGTTLQDNGVKLLATYYDGHTEIITGGYADNLDTNYYGSMIVTIGYKGVTTQLRVITERVKMTCSICGRTYYLYPDGTDPGCPYCITKIPVFTGNVLNYEGSEFTDTILEKLYTEGSYSLNKNDKFMITVESKSTTIARNILQKIYPSLSQQWFDYRKEERISAY